VDRAEEIPREGGRGWLLATPGGAGALSILASEPRRGTCARSERAILAQATLDQANHHQGRSRPDDASDHAQDGRGGHWVPDGRPRRGGDKSGCKAAPGQSHPACNVVARIPRTVEPEVSVERQTRSASGGTGRGQGGAQRVGAAWILAPDRLD